MSAKTDLWRKNWWTHIYKEIEEQNWFIKIISFTETDLDWKELQQNFSYHASKESDYNGIQKPDIHCLNEWTHGVMAV